MRADWFSRSVGRLALLILLSLALSACKTETDSADPAIIGVPPEDAYLGVEYSYNFGAVDKDDILSYSLTNAPSWLAMEDTTNKARQGIIIRGVPGITGGQRGRDDLGRTTRINLVGNDGVALGAQPFSVDVQENQVSVVSQDYLESRPEEDEEQEDEDEEEEERPDFQCEEPFIDGRGEHSYTINTYDDAGAKDGEETVTSETRPILVEVNLEQPSVTRIQLAFELTSGFDPNRCDDGFSPPHQRCDAGLANSDEAIIGRDVVGLGNGSGATFPVPDYIQYQQDSEGNFTQGVLTLEPGITECFVRLEIVDDLEPEKLEAFSFEFTEVRSGIVGLGPSNTGVREPLRIEDNEPQVKLQTLRHGKRDVINVGGTIEYKAVLEGDRSEPYSAKLGTQEGSDAIYETDFDLQIPNPDYDADTNPGVPEWIDGDEIAFPVGTNEVGFRIVVKNDAEYDNPADNDRVILLGLDQQYQAGRSNYAASDSDDDLRVSINEATATINVGNDAGFVPTDMVMGQDGRSFIAGYDTASGNQPKVFVYDQKDQAPVAEVVLFPRGISLEAPPVIGFSARDVEASDDEDVRRNEFAVSFGVEEDDSGTPTPGNINLVTQRWFFDTALSPSAYAQDWQYIDGTPRTDLPKWIGIAPTSGDVLVAGVTDGVFDASQTPRDPFGSFVIRINTEQDGQDLNPAVAWERKVESVSHDERVVGGGIQNTNPIVIGDSSGAVGGEAQSGGKDAFFYTAESADDTIDVQLVGTGADENLTDGFFEAGSVWLVGNSNGKYRVTTEQGVRVLRRTQTSSAAGFVFGYTPAGTVNETLLVNDEEDQTVETLRAGLVFDNDVIAAGSTTGQLTDNPDLDANTLEDPALFRRNRQPRYEEDEDDDEENDDLADDDKTLIVEPSQEWNQQLVVDDPATGVIEALTNYRDDEITALVKIESGGSTTWTLKLFDAEGDLLNP